jgi:hypothetical protein
LSAVSTAVTGFIGAALAGIIASGAWQRWAEQRQAETEPIGGAAAAAAGAAEANRPALTPAVATAQGPSVTRCSSAPPRSR